jgi:hypothetical protein
MNAIWLSFIIADGGRGIVVVYIEAVQIKYFLLPIEEKVKLSSVCV